MSKLTKFKHQELSVAQGYKKMKTAFWLYLFLGGIGAHRLYLRTGFKDWFFFVITGGYLGFGFIIDFVIILKELFGYRKLKKQRPDLFK